MNSDFIQYELNHFNKCQKNSNTSKIIKNIQKNSSKMKSNTFDSYKSTNLRLHNKLSQQDEYKGYLKRIQSIVDRKKRQDRSPAFYMTFLNKSRQKSKMQKQVEKDFLIQLENKNLLERIQKQKNRKLQKNNTLHEIHLYEKRVRDQEKINEENGKMAQRIMKQNSYLLNKSLLAFDHHPTSPDKGITQQRMTQLKFFDSRIKNRKLPKLMNSPSSPNTSLIR